MASAKSEFFDGMRKAVPIMVAAGPFGALFGALAVKNGFTVTDALAMSAFIYAGASQMVGLELFSANIAPWLIVFSIFAVNFRHILYSAVVGRRITHFTAVQRYVSFFFLIDPQFALIEERAEKGHPITFVWVMGVGLTFWSIWLGLTWVGALFGNLIEDPAKIGVDFLLPIYFLSLVMGFRKRANWASVVLASGAVSALAYQFIGSPWHVSIGALAGIALAAIVGVPRNHKTVV